MREWIIHVREEGSFYRSNNMEAKRPAVHQQWGFSNLPGEESSQGHLWASEWVRTWNHRSKCLDSSDITEGSWGGLLSGKELQTLLPNHSHISKTERNNTYFLRCLVFCTVPNRSHNRNNRKCKILEKFLCFLNYI